MQTTIRLSQLRFGAQFPGGSVNMRSTDKTTGLGELAEMIRSEISTENPSGLLQNLIVTPDPKKADVFYVIDGDRRLAALRALATDKAVGISDETSIPATVMKDTTPGSAMARSIAANTYLPPHPIDQFEAFARLESDGMEVAQIASRFGIKERTIRQRLALGKLSPKIRKLWRDGKINGQAAEAFTLAASHEVQDRIYAKLSKQHSLFAGSIKTEVGAADSDVAAALAFVGKKAYQDAGGTMVEDLFGGSVVVSDIDILNKLVGAKMAVEAERLKGEGWSFVKIEAEVGGDDYRYRRLDVKPAFTKDEAAKLKKLQKKLDTSNDYQESEATEDEIAALTEIATGRAFGEKEKAKSGVIVGYNREGALSVTYGLIAPKDDADDVKDLVSAGRGSSGKPKPKKEPGGLSGAVKQDLSERLTRAAREVVAGDPVLAVALAIAGIANSANSPVRLTSGGFEHSLSGAQFGKRLSEALSMTSTERGAALAVLVAGSLDMTQRAIDSYHQSVSAKEIEALADVLDEAKLRKALLAQFDPTDFFSRVSAKIATDALAEMGVDRPTAIKKKGELVTFAADHAKKHGWLPRELRTGAARKAKPAKAAKKKAPATAKAKPKSKSKSKKSPPKPRGKATPAAKKQATRKKAA